MSRPIARVEHLASARRAPHERDVLLADLAIVELPRKLAMRAIVLGHHHHSRRPAVETMHDARPRLAANAAQPVDVVQERVDERARRVPGGRVHDHARRLVDDHEVVVLVEDRERERFGPGVPRSEALER